MLHNAVRYGDADAPGEGPPVRAFLREADGLVTVRIANRVTAERTSPPARPRGIGRKLVDAFAMQLGAEVAADHAAGVHAVTIRFPRQTEALPEVDY
jgi:two-component sensor histidine kinase